MNRILQPVDTRHKLNVHKTLRRRRRRFLNVLCTFNLRPLSTENVGEKAFWRKKEQKNVPMIISSKAAIC